LNGYLRRLFPRVPLAVPFWNGETYRQILRCCFSGRIVDGPEIARLRSQIIAAFGVEDALLCGSGSLALKLALRACEVQPGDEVVLPAFCCSAVVPPILSVGAIPVLADVGEELNLTVDTAAAALTGKTRAIIVPHLFGNPADIEAIVELARPRNIRVIDDAAQALGATIKNRPAGSFGDAGVLSFGREKVCFGLGGGGLLSRSKIGLSGADHLCAQAPRLGPVLRNLAWTIFWRRWRRWTLPLEKTLWRSDDPTRHASIQSYGNEIMPNLNAAVALSLLHSLPDNIAARRARVRAYNDLLGRGKNLELISHRPGSVCLTQLIRVTQTRGGEDLALAVTQALRAAGYEVGGSYVPIHRLRENTPCVWDDLRRTDRIWPDLVELPCEPNVHLDDVERIATIVKTTTKL
jgi:dTDP-4-amino-4,6-dideoxygalactose transaminase